MQTYASRLHTFGKQAVQGRNRFRTAGRLFISRPASKCRPAAVQASSKASVQGRHQLRGNILYRQFIVGPDHLDRSRAEKAGALRGQGQSFLTLLILQTSRCIQDIYLRTITFIMSNGITVVWVPGAVSDIASYLKQARLLSRPS